MQRAHTHTRTHTRRSCVCVCVCVYVEGKSAKVADVGRRESLYSCRVSVRSTMKQLEVKKKKVNMTHVRVVLMFLSPPCGRRCALQEGEARGGCRWDMIKKQVTIILYYID